MTAWPLPLVALGVALALTTLVWLASLAKRDASIIDVFWGRASSSWAGSTSPRGTGRPCASRWWSAWSPSGA